MRNSSVIGRVAAVAALAIALVAVVVILFSSGSSYQVRAVFQNASQIVQGDLIEVSGNEIGTVSKIALTPSGEAELTLNINNSAYSPLHQGTQATIRELSLSGIASRYVSLQMGASNAPQIANNGVIADTNTTSEVDLDQIFNTLNGPTRKGLEQVLLGSASQYKNAGAVAQKAFPYLNPAIAASAVLFNEIDRNTNQFTQYVTKNGNLVNDLAQRSSDLSGLIQHLSTTTGALAAERAPLGQSLKDLPPFLRLANTTFVNLRNALNDVTPLVNISKQVHVAPELEKLLVQLRPLANDAVPTVRDLAQIVSRPGAANDLTDLTRLGVPLAAASVRNINVDGKVRPGAFPESVTSLNDSTPELATDRPYSVDLTGWFEGFTHPGGDDANGGYSRVAPVVGVGSISNGALNLFDGGGLLTNPADFGGRQTLAFGSNGNNGILTTGQGDRCPGSMERGAVWYPETGFPCNPKEVPTGS